MDIFKNEIKERIQEEFNDIIGFFQNNIVSLENIGTVTKKTDSQKDNERHILESMMMIIGLFNPQLDNVITTVPENIWNISKTRNRLEKLLSSPADYIKHDSIFDYNIKQEDASNYIRVIIMNYLDTNKSCFDNWNDYFPKENKMTQQDIKNLKGHILKTKESTDKRFKIGLKRSGKLIKEQYGRYGMFAGTTGLSTMAALAGTAGAITVTALSIGIAGVAVLAVATIAYLYYRRKERKTNNEMRKLLKKKYSNIHTYSKADLIKTAQQLDDIAMGDSLVGDKNRVLGGDDLGKISKEVTPSLRFRVS